MPAQSVPIDEFSLRSRTREAGGFRFFDGRFAPHVEIPWHLHANPGVLVVLDGAIDERCESRTFACTAGHLLSKPAGERHRDQVSGYGVRAVAIEVAAARSAAHGIGARGVMTDKSPRALEIAAQIAVEMRARDDAAPLALEGLALELLALVIRLARDDHATRAPAWLALVRDRIIAGAPGSVPSVHELARACGRHPAYLARAFRRYYGTTVAGCVRASRLEWAARQLEASNEPLSVLALRAGFCDQSHFTRAFRRHVRASPNAYRALARAAHVTECATERTTAE